MRDPDSVTVTCRSTAVSTGCGHPVDWHVGAATINPDCDCCSWRKVPQARWVTGPLGLPVTERTTDAR